MRRLAIALTLLVAACASVRPQAATEPRQPAPAQAWVAFDARGVTLSGASGVADRRTGRIATIDDPVRVASISKLVVALAVMRLVEAGHLDLDEDVSVKLGWRLRNPAFPDVPITFRLLLSHRSSLTDGVDYIVPLGRALKDVLADPAAWDAGHAPGGWFHYTNLNFPVIAQVMEAATGERFDRLMARLILAPLKLDACYNWTMCSDAAFGRAVVLYRPNGDIAKDDLGGRRPACPITTLPDDPCDLDRYALASNGAIFSPQGGLRISMRDLATIGRLLLGQGMLDGQRLLTPQSVAALLAPQWRFDGGNGVTEGGFYCAYGLAAELLASAQPGCRDDPFGGARAMAGHAGEAYNLRSGLWIDRATATGIAFFAADNPDPAPTGRSAFTAIEERLATHLPH